MAITLKEKQEKGLLKKFHTLCGKAGMNQDDKDAILASYGATSSKELDYIQLMEICTRLEKQADPKLNQLDENRKRLMASVGGWLRLMGVPSNASKIKAIACRAAQRADFNEIPLEQLRSLYAAFNKKQRDLKQVEQMTDEMIDYLSLLN